ncbi:MAG UNVERIFIED_CONTAM: type II toxin-antitoxin system PemK/MazF family toxin [Anaerolineae bacterium]|jgi:mRNA interferase MazF
MGNPTTPQIQRGQVWDVQFSPQVGSELKQKHPAIVMNVAGVARLPLHIVVPVTTGHPRFKNFIWMIPLEANRTNGLDHDCFADAFQTRFISEERFLSYRGLVSPAELAEISAVIAYIVGYVPPKISP